MNSIFSKNLKLLRENSNLKQESLANKLDISKSVLSYYENNKSEPTMSVLIKISSFFNIDIDTLVNEDLSSDNLSIRTKINSVLNSSNNIFINNKSTINSIFIDLERKKNYYEYLINKEIPGKINEIDSLVEYLKLYENAKNININNTKEDTENFNEEYADELVPNITDITSYRKTKSEIVEEDDEEEIEYRHIIDRGCIPAGKLRETFADDFGTFEVPENKLSRKKDYYILTISGDSMDKYYPDGEKILVEDTISVNYGDIVIARVNDSATVKKLSKTEKGIELIPLSHNPEHKTQIVTDKEFIIQGKVLGLLSEFLD